MPGLAVFLLCTGLSPNIPFPIAKPAIATHPSPVAHEQPIRSADQPKPTGPLLVEIARSAEERTEADREAAYKAEDARNNTLLTVFNGVLALVAALQFIYIVRQERWMRASAEAARDSANAAQEAVDATQRIGEAQTRAYVDISRAIVIFLEFAGGVDAQPLVSITARNTGQSPARNFVWNPSIQYIALGNPTHQKYSNLGSNWRETQGVVIPIEGEVEDSALFSGMMLYAFFRETGEPKDEIMVRIRIEFEFLDAFERPVSDEAYFVGIFSRMQSGTSLGTPWGESKWKGNAQRIHKLKDWPTDGASK
jgi:hypothetical protein